ncbi:MAG: hypothetical protein RL328_2008, partial [Acidobacteriota bacterium]
MRTGLGQMAVFWVVPMGAAAWFAASRGEGRYALFSFAMGAAACLPFLLTLICLVQEGFGRVGEVARIRLLGSVLTNGMASVLILGEWGILLYPVGTLVAAVATGALRRDRVRYAVSTICAYVSFQTPALWLAGYLEAPVFAAWAMTAQVMTTIAS